MDIKDRLKLVLEEVFKNDIDAMADAMGVHRTTLAFTFVTVDTLLLACGLSVVLGVAAGWLAARRLVAVPALALLGR